MQPGADRRLRLPKLQGRDHGSHRSLLLHLWRRRLVPWVVKELLPCRRYSCAGHDASVRWRRAPLFLGRLLLEAAQRPGPRLGSARGALQPGVRKGRAAFHGEHGVAVDLLALLLLVFEAVDEGVLHDDARREGRAQIPAEKRRILGPSVAVCSIVDVAQLLGRGGDLLAPMVGLHTGVAERHPPRPDAPHVARPAGRSFKAAPPS
mmetsp:Transcript_129939/g.363687  ORF Transcript_129939/g.363687 Transcript_129939/m.363687 type:complete len:206 (+) Transcript_129939:297-914(+)